METNTLLENLTNPALLFFLLGIIATQIKSDLRVPEQSGKFISVYLLICIGFKGGQELSHSPIDFEIFSSILLGLFLAIMIPLGAFFILKQKLKTQNAGAIAASYGSVSAVTFITAISFLDFENIDFGGHMIAVMAIMEAPAIIVGALLIKKYSLKGESSSPITSCLTHALTNGSVFLILGSLLIGFFASEKQAAGIAPFTTDIFKGFLAIFLLDMGLKSGKQIHLLTKHGITPFAFAAIMPFIHGAIAVLLSSLITHNEGNQLLFAILGAGASYIAVPAAMRTIAPKANPSLYLPMALGITFPINVIIGIPMYYSIIDYLKL